MSTNEPQNGDLTELQLRAHNAIMALLIDRQLMSMSAISKKILLAVAALSGVVIAQVEPLTRVVGIGSVSSMLFLLCTSLLFGGWALWLYEAAKNLRMAGKIASEALSGVSGAEAFDARDVEVLTRALRSTTAWPMKANTMKKFAIHAGALRMPWPNDHASADRVAFPFLQLANLALAMQFAAALMSIVVAAVSLVVRDVPEAHSPVSPAHSQFTDQRVASADSSFQAPTTDRWRAAHSP